MKLAISERCCRGISGIEACLTNRTWNLVPKCGDLVLWLRDVAGGQRKTQWKTMHVPMAAQKD